MVSDVLFETLEKMRPYMDKGIYEEFEETMIRRVYDDMWKLMVHLDTPPGTDSEPALENKAGK